MCKFFSFRSDGNGKYYYFNKQQREKIRNAKENPNSRSKMAKYDEDSHTSIAHYYGFTGSRDDILHRYEYDPVFDKFIVDTIVDGIHDDSKEAEKWVRSLDFNTIDSSKMEKIQQHKRMDADRLRTFVVGDHCKIRTEDQFRNIFGEEGRNSIHIRFGWNNLMDAYMGKNVTIREIKINDRVYFEEKEFRSCTWFFSTDMLEKI